MTSADSVALRIDQRPLYAQAGEALRNLIQRGGYAPGDRLPSEMELSQLLGISRPTLREALRLLEDEGTIIRRQGVGTFVATSQPVIESGLEVLESIDRMAHRLGLSTGMAEARTEERAASANELEQLGLSNDAAVTVVTRVITTGGKRVAHLTDVVPQEFLRKAELLVTSSGFTQPWDQAFSSRESAMLARGLEAPPATRWEDSGPSPAGQSFHGSVLDYFRARSWPALSHSRTELSAEAADLKLAHALGVSRGAPLLKLEARLYAQDGRVVDYSISRFVPGHFRLHVVRRIG